MTDDQKLRMIQDMCYHPGAFHWTRHQMAKAILNVINGKPINYQLSDLDKPINYELTHDAVFSDDEVQ